MTPKISAQHLLSSIYEGWHGATLTKGDTMKHIKNLFIIAGLLTMGLLANAQRGGGGANEQYLSSSELISLQGPDQVVPVRKLLGIQRGQFINNLVVVGSSMAGHGRLEVRLNNQVIFQTVLSTQATSYTVPIFKQVGSGFRTLQFHTFGNVSIFHTGLAVTGNNGGSNPPPRPILTTDIQCYNLGSSYTTCPVNGNVLSVTLLRQTSTNQCILGRSFGVMQNQSAIWVQNGCSGLFRVEYN